MMHENIEEILNKLGTEDVPAEASQIAREISKDFSETLMRQRKHIFLEYIMKSQITKLAAAAVIIVAVVLAITVWNESAYALTHTIEANHTVRYLHIKYFASEHEDEPKKFWLEFDANGEVRNVRMDFPEWASGGDGPKVVVWKENKAQVWFRRKNGLLTVRDKSVAESMLKLAQECDPRLTVERLYEQQTQGKIKIEIDQPSDKVESIVVTATYLPESSSPRRRLVLFVDQATKLVIATEFYRLKDGEYEYIGIQEYYNYNQPIDARMFTLDDEVPADVMRVDQTIQDVGLAQGNLSDEEVAVEVARQFFEAMIAADYTKAGKLLEGIPADTMQQMFGHIKFLRIISIGPAGPHPNPATGGLVVPSTVEIEKDGQISKWKRERLGVRQVFNQPGRWTIFGGI